MIYLDQHAEPSDIVRTLWRELGPQACIAIAITLATRSTGLDIDLSGLSEEEPDEG